MNTIKKMLAIATVCTALLSQEKAEAQPPLYAGFTGSAYLLESRIENVLDKHLQLTEIAKTFRTEIPAWAYLGITFDKDGADKPFYGIGASINYPDYFHLLPTIEGYGKSFTGFTCYSSTALPKNWGIDIVPNLDKELKYNKTAFSIYKIFPAITIGITSGHEKSGWRGLRDIDYRAGIYFKTCNITADANIQKKSARIAFQTSL